MRKYDATRADTNIRQTVLNTLAARDSERSRFTRLTRLGADTDIANGASRTVVYWLRQALRAERGRAISRNPEYSFTRHMAILRALDAEIGACGKMRSRPALFPHNSASRATALDM